MKTTKLYSWIAIIVILTSGVIHLYNAPGEFQDAPYMGILFFIFFLGSIVSAIGIYRGELLWGWALGGFLSFGAIVGYLISRTVGMPISGIEAWGPTLAYFSIFLELIYFATLLGSKPTLLQRAN